MSCKLKLMKHFPLCVLRSGNILFLNNTQLTTQNYKEVYNSLILTHRPLVTSCALSRIKSENYPSLTKGDQRYFDFKELECNASAERRMGYFVALMCEVFQLSEEEAEEIMEYYPFLWKEFSLKTFSYLKSLGLEKKNFMKYPWLISMSSEDIDSKLKIISSKYADLGSINLCAILLKYPNERIETLVLNWKKEATDFEHPSKFHYLANTLKVSLVEVMDQLDAKSFLLSFPYSRIQEGVKLCLDAGVQREDLIKDLWVLRNRTVKIRNRIETLLQSKIPVKPWVLRARVESFETYIQEYWREKKDVEDDVHSYLLMRLKCDPNEIDRMMKVYPNLQRATIQKIKPNIDYLLIEKGISPHIIIMTPRILCQKHETVKERVNRLETMGISYNSLWVVSKPQKHFDKFIQRWKS